MRKVTKLKQYNGLELPVFSCAFVAGLILKKLFDLTKVSDYVSRETVQREGSFFTDLLVTCGVASIKLGVVVQYWLPLLVLVLVGVAVVFAITFYFGRRLSPSYWFERSIFSWGWWTGTMAMGIALERIVDPQMKSKTMDDYALVEVSCNMGKYNYTHTLFLRYQHEQVDCFYREHIASDSR